MIYLLIFILQNFLLRTHKAQALYMITQGRIEGVRSTERERDRKEPFS